MWVLESKFLTRFEPGLLDSKSRVIRNYTIGPYDIYVYENIYVIYVISPTGFEPAILRFVVSRLIHWATGT